MKTDLANIISKRPYYLLLLPIFFVLHGFRENYSIVFAKDALILTGWYLLATFILLGIFYLFTRNLDKAALMTFTVMAFNFFFGALHDLFKKIDAIPLLSRYVFILPFFLILIISIFILIRRSKQKFIRLNKYLNALFIFLILFDTGMLIFKMFRPVRDFTLNHNWQTCKDCPNPDVFLIIADGYPGRIQLRDLMQVDNSGFESELKKRGFHVTDSSLSNYNFTPFSMAAMLNMDYLSSIQGSNTNLEDMRICYTTIKQGTVLQFFNSRGYDLYNFSIFDFKNDPSLATPTFLPGKTSSITSQTLLKRLEKNLAHNLVTRFKVPYLQRWVLNHELKNNTKLLAKTEKLAIKKTATPKFVYTHIVMPHYPYYYDSSGNKVADEFLPTENATNLDLFRQYLIYSNQRYLKLIDHIKNSTNSNAIIIFASDHGFREFKNPVPKRYHFLNLNSVYLPNGNYTGFYNGMSNVNIFRALLNSQFNQQLPMLRDSTSFLRE